MLNFDINQFRRVGGASSKQLSADLKESLASNVASTDLSAAQLTSEFFSGLEGTWVGNKGWNLIALPSKGSVPTEKGQFLLLIQPYIETLTFTNAGAMARNRGGSVDQFIGALEYNQRVTDQETNELLHAETGMFMNLSQIVDNDNNQQPMPEFNIARSGTIPHGDSVMLLSKPPFVVQGPPDIPVISSLPQNTGPAPLGYTDPYLVPHKGLHVVNPNATLMDDLDKQKAEGFEVIETSTVVLNSKNNGGITNIPFIKNHANAVNFESIFWLEKVKNTATGQVFDQLQYTQIIDLAFHHSFDPQKPDELIIWPHITINTMVKQ